MAYVRHSPGSPHHLLGQSTHSFSTSTVINWWLARHPVIQFSFAFISSHASLCGDNRFITLTISSTRRRTNTYTHCPGTQNNTWKENANRETCYFSCYSKSAVIRKAKLNLERLLLQLFKIEENCGAQDSGNEVSQTSPGTSLAKFLFLWSLDTFSSTEKRNKHESCKISTQQACNEFRNTKFTSCLHFIPKTWCRSRYRLQCRSCIEWRFLYPSQ